MAPPSTIKSVTEETTIYSLYSIYSQYIHCHECAIFAWWLVTACLVFARSGTSSETPRPETRLGLSWICQCRHGARTIFFWNWSFAAVVVIGLSSRGKQVKGKKPLTTSLPTAQTWHSAELQMQNVAKQTSVDYCGNKFGCNPLLQWHNPKETTYTPSIHVSSLLSCETCALCYLSNASIKIVHFLFVTKHRESCFPLLRLNLPVHPRSYSFIPPCLCISGLSNFKLLRCCIVLRLSTGGPVMKQMPPFFLSTPVQISALQISIKHKSTNQNGAHNI
jgi:hypothetical protein